MCLALRAWTNRSTSVLLACLFVLGLGLPLAPLFGEPACRKSLVWMKKWSALYDGIDLRKSLRDDIWRSASNFWNCGPALGELLLPLR